MFAVCVSGHQSGFCMICVMQNHIIQAFANTGNAIKPVSFIRDLKSKTTSFFQHCQTVSEQFFLSTFQCRLCQETQTPAFFFELLLNNCQKHDDATLATVSHVTAASNCSPKVERCGCRLWMNTVWRVEKRCELHLDLVKRCAWITQEEPSLHPSPLPTCLLRPYVLLQSCLHLLRLFFFSISPLHPSSFPDALSVSLWLQAERSSFSTKNVQSTDFASFQPGHRERCTGCVFYAGRSFHWGRQGHFSGSLHFNTYISLNVEWKWQSCTSCFEERWVSSHQQT